MESQRGGRPCHTASWMHFRSIVRSDTESGHKTLPCDSRGGGLTDRQQRGGGQRLAQRKRRNRRDKELLLRVVKPLWTYMEVS